MLRSILTVAAVATILFSTNAFAFVGPKKKRVNFTVRIENISDKEGLAAADGTKYPFALSPGVYAVSNGKLEIFKPGGKAIPALEAQAEDGDAETLYNHVLAFGMPGSYGVFKTPVGTDMPAPILPGGVYEFSFTATAGRKLNLIAMYGQSNDLFYAPTKAIELFDKNGEPLSGDITAEFMLWDAGTEVNQAPGIGPDQAPRQKMKNNGPAEKGVVALVNDGFAYPGTQEVLRITITANQ